MSFKNIIGVVAGLAIVSYLVLPIVVVVLVSITANDFISMPNNGISIKHYVSLWNDPRWLRATTNSMVVALASTLIAGTTGTFAAIAAWRLSPQARVLISVGIVLPLAIPTIIQTLGLYRLFVTFNLVDTFPGIIVAHSILALPYVYLTVSASVSGLDPRLEQAARSLGASVFQTTTKVIMPSVVPGILAGSLIAFVFSFDEVIATVFLTGLRTLLLPKVIWDGTQDDLSPAIAAMCSLIIAITVTISAAGLITRYRRSGT